MVGTRIGDVEIVAELAREGIYRGKTGGRSVDVKVFDASDDPQRKTVALVEARVMAKFVGQRAVPEILAVGEAEGRTYFTLAPLDGSTVAELLESGPLDPELAVAICRAAARSLDAVHGTGFVHRDVRPANLLVVEDGDDLRVVVLGLGRVKPTDGTSRLPASTEGPYVSPEQRADPATVDVRTDVYALGAVLAEMLGDAGGFDDVTRNALADRDRRFASMTELLDALA